VAFQTSADFTTIQAAINAFYVQPGDTILVRPGLYTGTLYLGSKDLVVAAGQSPGELKVKLEAVGPVGALAVASGYPVDVLWRGRVLARGQAQARVEIPAGRQVVTLVAPAYFLRADVAVTVPAGGEARVEAPALGKLNVRAIPDNCQIFVDGMFVDYPPILDRAVAAGPRTVAFKWPDGAKSEETVEVPRRSGQSRN